MKKGWAHSILLCLAVGRAAGAEFAFENVRALAENRAARPFAPAKEAAGPLLNLTYEQYAAIRFDDRKALWREAGLPFELEFFLCGYRHKQVVALHEIDAQQVRDIAFDASLFDRGTNRLLSAARPGYAGLRIGQPDSPISEVAVFLDASYFRMIGRGQTYGTSARGLALNTVANEPEEFPAFQQFWVRRPEPKDRELTAYALMDSPSVAGAYRFVIRPGTTTVAVVKAALFPRRTVKEFGIAPLTSMFLYGKNGHPPFVDFRPEVHDADGLLMQTGRGEWIWRPLEGGKMTRVDTFQDEGPRGFGLMQRERDFERYQDLAARYQSRPSVWVQPLGNWGKGSVEFVQLASDDEAFDNVVAFWRPAVPPPPGRALEVDYEWHWTTNDPSPQAFGHVQATRIGRMNRVSQRFRFVVEFGGAAVESLPRQEPLIARVEYGVAAGVVRHDLFKNEYNQSWRLVIEMGEPRQALNLRARLERSGRPITETWDYCWQP